MSRETVSSAARPGQGTHPNVWQPVLGRWKAIAKTTGTSSSPTTITTSSFANGWPKFRVTPSK